MISQVEHKAVSRNYKSFLSIERKMQGCKINSAKWNKLYSQLEYLHKNIRAITEKLLP